MRWLSAAAEDELAEAQFQLGLMYFEGSGVAENETTAAQWFKKAAIQDLAVAQRYLGFQYYHGMGVSIDYDAAAEWMRKAATQGDDIAQMFLGVTPRVHRADSGSTGTNESEVELDDEAEREPYGYGSGFAISAKGHVVTSAHVIEGCGGVTAGPSEAEVLAYDLQNDLALIRPSKSPVTYARFRQGRGVRPGDSIVVIGYPLPALLSSEPSVATGIVSALSRQGEDRRFMQISPPIQPANSGGPLLDGSGNVVGIVASKLDAVEVARATGDIPQNVNFAINAGTIRAFLYSYRVEYETSQSTVPVAPADIAARARSFTMLVICWK